MVPTLSAFVESSLTVVSTVCAFVVVEPTIRVVSATCLSISLIEAASSLVACVRAITFEEV